jgi:Polyketide cyclase / dehydrase and lipid transport
VPENTWTHSFSIDTPVTSDAIWNLLSDMSLWHEWNAGVKSVRADGPFQKGTWFSMTLPDGETIRTQLVEVVGRSRFVDETRVGDTVVRVDHQVQDLGNGMRRVTYAIEATGPGAAEIGQAVSADFPEVLASLVQLAGTQLANDHR